MSEYSGLLGFSIIGPSKPELCVVVIGVDPRLFVRPTPYSYPSSEESELPPDACFCISAGI